jgi:UDP-GlcNAc:undecaprenyl-phosphate GlcNAc-1-phosphate transferase
MIRRMVEGRSPFSSDRNHLHHKLLYLGFGHREAVILIHVLQAILLLVAYFLRFESDVLIVAVYASFALATLGSLRWLGRAGWRAKPDIPGGSRPPSALRLLSLRLPGPRLQNAALGAMSAGLAAYVAVTLCTSGRIGSDLGVLCLALLAMLLIVLGVARTEVSRTWVERAAAYVGVMMIVYLDQTAPARSGLVASLSWTLLAITGGAAVLRFWLSPTRRFEVTSLDVLVVFIAIVLPNLPGSLQLPSDLPAGITKAVVLLYVVEALLALEVKRGLPRAALALTFGAIAVRSLVAPVL